MPGSADSSTNGVRSPTWLWEVYAGPGPAAPTVARNRPRLRRTQRLRRMTQATPWP